MQLAFASSERFSDFDQRSEARNFLVSATWDESELFVRHLFHPFQSLI
jgi:hypothetical protein